MSGGIDVGTIPPEEIERINAEFAAAVEAQNAAAAEAARVAAEQAAAEAARIAAWNAVPQWYWAPDFSQVIDRRRFPEAVWFPGDAGGGSEGGPAQLPGFRVTRCDYGSEGYGCSSTYVGMWDDQDCNACNNTLTYHRLVELGLWNLLDPNSVTWNFLQSRAGGLDPRMDSAAFGKAILSLLGDFVTSKWEFEPIKNGVRTMLAGLNPQFVEAMADAIANYYNQYWSSQQSHGFFGDFFRGVFSFAGELLQLPPIRAMLAAISLGSSEAFAAAAEVGAELAAEEVATEVAFQEFLPELVEIAAPEIAFEVAAPEIALELAPDIVTQALPEVVEIAAPEITFEVAAPDIVAEVSPALEPQMFDFDFFDIADVDFAGEFSGVDFSDFAGVDFGAGEMELIDFAPQPEGFLDNWDLLPDDTIVFQEPEVLDLPPVESASFSTSDVLRTLQQGTGVVRSLLPLFQDGAAYAAASGGTTTAPRTLPRQLPALPGSRTVTLPTGSAVVGDAAAAPNANLVRYGLLALAAFAALKGVG